MTGGVKRGVTNPWLLEEPEETRGLGFDDLRQQQRRIIEEQDAGLDALSSIISRQKQMGQEIGNELDEQNANIALSKLCLGLQGWDQPSSTEAGAFKAERLNMRNDTDPALPAALQPGGLKKSLVLIMPRLWVQFLEESFAEELDLKILVDPIH
ncbi:hypothetical protein BTVI_66000 [Pitangus sulphuratus]|nr:hypothetical protein BTVI_66000 [Pitangus sulphuratus]